jgi:hypothetical protein
VADESVQVDSPAEADDDAPQPAAPADEVLERYRASMHRGRRVYFAIIAVIVAALGIWAATTWSSGEAAHTSLHTFAPAPPTEGIQTPTAAPQEVWHTSDRIAIGEPQYGGTIVTYSRHTVGGRDARTGKRTWSYTRTDRNVCTAAQLTGTTIAVFAVHGNCDELTALDSDTGRRRWTRTLDMDGMPVNGQPAYQITPYTFLAATPSVIYAIDPVSGYNRWTYQRFGCRIDHVVLGGAGALISQTCSQQVKCVDVKFCGTGPQLLLRNGSDPQDDDKKPNADRIDWIQRGDTNIPVSAEDVTSGDVVSTVDPTGNTLQLLDSDTGKQTQTLALTPATSGLGPISATATDGAEIVWLSGETYAVQPNASIPLWRTNSSAPPAVASTTGETPPALSTARITVATSSGVAIVDGNDGNLSSFTLGPPVPGSRAYSLGTGFLVASSAGIVAYK